MKCLLPNQNIIEAGSRGDNNTFYGLQAWTVNTTDGHKINYFSGLLGQYNIIVDDLDILISVFSTDKKEGTRQNAEKAVKNYVENARKAIYG